MRRVRGRSAVVAEAEVETGAERFRFMRGLFPRGGKHDQQSISNRVHMAVDTLPMLLLANVAVAGGLWLIRQPQAGNAAFWLIVLPLLFILAAGGGVLLLARRERRGPASPERMHAVVALFGLAQGLAWSIWMAGADRDMTSPHWPIAAIAYSALLVITTLVLAPVPTAALALWLTLSTTAAIAAGQWAALVMLVPLLGVAVVALGGSSERSSVASRPPSRRRCCSASSRRTGAGGSGRPTSRDC